MSKKLAVVIGAGRGMGNHIAERFAKENFRVVLVSRRQNLLDEYAAELSAKGFEVFAHAADVSDTASLTKLFADVHEKFGAVDGRFKSGGSNVTLHPAYATCRCHRLNVVAAN